MNVVKKFLPEEVGERFVRGEYRPGVVGLRNKPSDVDPVVSSPSRSLRRDSDVESFI